MSREANFDRVSLGELQVEFISQNKVMRAKLKLVDTKTGKSFGSMTITNWSESVKLKLKEFRKAVEEEAEGLIFSDVTPEEKTGATEKGEDGLGEFLEGNADLDDVPSL